MKPIDILKISLRVLKIAIRQLTDRKRNRPPPPPGEGPSTGKHMNLGTEANVGTGTDVAAEASNGIGTEGRPRRGSRGPRGPRRPGSLGRTLRGMLCWKGSPEEAALESAFL